jgi:hypothetical protein
MYKVLIFVIDFPIIITFTKKALQFIFLLLTSVIVTKKNGFSYQNRLFRPPKKNVTKMGVIIKRV